MRAFDTGAAILALRYTALLVAADAIRAGRSLDAIQRAFARRYQQLTGGDEPADAWARLAAHAHVVAAWGQSDRKALADEYEQQVGAPPPCVTVERVSADGRLFGATVPLALDDLRAEVALWRQVAAD